MNCKHCQQELDQGNPICPHCGTDNAAPAEPPVQAEAAQPILETPAEAAAVEAIPETATEEAAQEPALETEAAEEKKPSAGRLTMAVIACVVLVAVLAAVVLGGMGVIGGETTDPTKEVLGTVPADGDPNDETCKGTYTGSDDAVIAAGDVVVATCGDRQLTNSQLQIFYWMLVNEFTGTYSYNSLDLSQPLDTQACEISEGRTWQQYFLAAALTNWQSYASMAQVGAAAGVTLPQEDVDALASMAETLDTQAKTYGYESAEAMIQATVGKGGELQSYVDFTSLNWESYAYYMHAYETMSATEDEIAAYYEEYEAEYLAEEITRELKVVDVRHILILPEGATLETIRTDEFPEEAWAAALTQMEALQTQWLEAGGTEEQFAELAGEHTADPGSLETGGLYTNIYQGDMVEAFDSWCFDAERKVGDYGIVKTELGYHFMYFSGENFLWDDYAEADLLTEKLAEHIQSAMEAYSMEVDYKSILLGYVELSN